MITDTLEHYELDRDEELHLIRVSHDRVTFGDSSVPSAAALNAKELLIRAYAPLINRMSKVRGLDWDEVEAELMRAFLDAVEEYDFASGNRLSHELRFRFVNAKNRVSAAGDPIMIPLRQRALYYQILYKEAEGSWTKGAELADAHPKMSRATFVAISQALNVGPMSDVERSMWDHSEASDFEMVEFVSWLRGRLNTREALVIDLHYGFSDHAEVNELRLAWGFGYDDAIEIPQIATMLGVHRQTAWRIHNSALDEMRANVNAD